MKINCLIAGVGGQGTILLSRLIGMAGIAAGFSLRGTETIGMAQRGGSVVSHVRLSNEGEIDSPFIPLGQADLLLAFEPGEGVRSYPLLAPEGAAIVLDKVIKPVTSSLAGDNYQGGVMLDFLRANVYDLRVLDTRGIMAQAGAKALNVVLLGVAVAGGYLPFSLVQAEEAITRRLPGKYLAMNHQALQLGADLAKKGQD